MSSDKDDKDLKDGRQLVKELDGDTADTPGTGPETTGVIIHGNDPEDPPPGDDEEEEGEG